MTTKVGIILIKSNNRLKFEIETLQLWIYLKSPCIPAWSLS